MRSRAALVAFACAVAVGACGEADGGVDEASSTAVDLRFSTGHPSATAPSRPGELFVYGDDAGGAPVAAFVDVVRDEARVIPPPPVDPRALAPAAARVGDHIVLVAIRCDETLGSESEECRPGTYEVAVLPLDDGEPGDWRALHVPDGLRDTESLLARPFGSLDDRRLVIQAGPDWGRHWIVDVVTGSFEEVPLPPGDVDDSCLAGTRLVAVERPKVVDDGTPQTFAPDSSGPPSLSVWWIDVESGGGWEPLPALAPGPASTYLECTATHVLAWDGGRLDGLRALAVDDPSAWTQIGPPEPGAFAQYTASQGGDIVFEGAPGGRWRLDPSGSTWAEVPVTDGYMNDFHWAGDELLGWELFPSAETTENSSRPVRIELTAPD